MAVTLTSCCRYIRTDFCTSTIWSILLVLETHTQHFFLAVSWQRDRVSLDNQKRQFLLVGKKLIFIQPLLLLSEELWITTEPGCCRHKFLWWWHPILNSCTWSADRFILFSEPDISGKPKFLQIIHNIQVQWVLYPLENKTTFFSVEECILSSWKVIYHLSKVLDYFFIGKNFFFHTESNFI